MTGLVETSSGANVQLSTSEGKRYRLLLLGEAAPIAHLDGGFLVEVEGQRVLRGIRVADWRILEGAHGMSTWTGRLESRGVQIGLQDRNSGGFYLVTEKAVRELEPHLGRPVVLEGFISGPHRIEVMYFRVLE